MTQPAYRPRLWAQFAFNADPNEIETVPVWSDWTNKLRKVTPSKRGRQYELAITQSATPTLTFRDPDEYLNPANTSSPHYPNVQPYRQLLLQGMYPPAAVGSAVNLVNSLRWKANNATAPDPSFESYANGASMPGWLTALGGVVPTVTTTNPQQGTKSLTYTVAAVATRQGVSWEADCVPGQQYTASAYVRQSSASTQQLVVRDQTLAYDNFGRSASSSWGSADSGQAWVNTGGSAADFSVSGGRGLHSNASVNVLRNSLLDMGTDAIDMMVRVDTALAVVPTGASIMRWVIARAADTSNFYAARLEVTTGAIIRLALYRCVAGVFTAIGSPVTLGLMTVADTWAVRFDVTGTDLSAKAWLTSKNEPASWQITATDSNITTGTKIGVISRLESGNTNGTVSTAYDNLMCSGGLASTTTTTTGSYVRLTHTFTATQPVQTIAVCTRGTASAGTVNVDAIQHETGASASTFSTSGPVIFPILRDYAERFPREWDAAGFVGIAPVPAVDGFAALAATSLRTEYPEAVLSLAPLYYWPLAGAPGTLQTPDISGNGGPALTQADGSVGVDTVPVFGTGIEIVGNPGATGVYFDPGASFDGMDSILSCGRTTFTPGTNFPPTGYFDGWGGTMSCWVQLTNPGNGAFIALIYGQTSSSTTYNTTPMALGYDTASRHPFALLQSVSGGLVQYTSTGGELNDLEPHHLLMTATQVVGGNTTVKLWVDGTLVGTATGTTASVGLLSAPGTIVNVGANAPGGVAIGGTISDVAIWDRVLTDAEIATLWSAGGLGYAGETTGERWERHLQLGRYAGPARISTGSTTLGPATYTGKIDLLTDGQNLAVAELGAHWIAPDGADVFEGRQDRWLRLTSSATFGEDSAAGEIPYLDGVLFDFDPTFVYANVQITRNDGSVMTGGTVADINTATRKYFGRSYAIGADFEDDLQAQDYADYVFNTHKAPVQRVGRLTVDPSANPALFAKALLLEVGQRVTVKRRAKAANGGAGITMSSDYFIESVEHGEIDMDRGQWRINFWMSPIGLGPNVTFQPWILENATYGVLDSTTVLGF